MNGSISTNKLFIVILSFNEVEATLACLKSLEHQTSDKFCLLVIDNCSSGDAVSIIRQEFPSVEIQALSENLGWAGGNNVGIRRGLADRHNWVMLLNNDTVLPADTVEKMVAFLDVLEPSIFVPAIRYLYEPSEMQLDPSKGIFTGHPAYVGDQPAVFRESQNLWELDFVYGACMVVHHSIFESIGLMEEKFFLQMEETDFFLRAKKSGFKTFCATSICIDHAESLSFGGKVTPTKTYYIARNNLLLAERHVRSISSLRKVMREYYYFLAAKCRSAGRPDSVIGMLRWLVSPDANARACRLAFGHYITRRFGKLDNTLLHIKN
jgi:GT2 family glycosyltransferase